MQALLGFGPLGQKREETYRDRQGPGLMPCQICCSQRVGIRSDTAAAPVSKKPQ